MQLGRPHLHLQSIGSTNQRARELAAAGAPHGTLVTADHQTAGRGRQGRDWVAPPGSSALISVVLRDPPALLPLIAAVAVAESCGPQAQIKWPNDILIEDSQGRLGKVAGILCEGRPQEGWGVVGIGINVALDLDAAPEEIRTTAATLALEPSARRLIVAQTVAALGAALLLPPDLILERWRQRDALAGSQVSWQTAGGLQHGTAIGVGGDGALRVESSDGEELELDGGEVHLEPAGD
ncbi:MAG: biotin--[acetyl-CoA-carboxylase] ligase [Actinobacteria bacterium]|uniref:Unannotated protein n=1 Tax=freshwater metagenome TaxID=449393 RepID=A0A6J5Z093_9ZZZZ|nr:biotin--[acetyl-CoA-carboxylase] ligase [Actinomycetota bacterium]